MSKNKEKRDIITEEEFNRQTEGDIALPENDSPDDSDESISSEYAMGVNFMPDEVNEIQGEDGTSIGEKIYADEHSRHSRNPSSDPAKDQEIILPDTAVVVSSGGMPVEDLDSKSDTH